MKMITEAYGQVNNTYTFNLLYAELEQYTMLLMDQFKGIYLSLIAVILVVFFITVNVQVTALVVLSVLLVDFYLLALMFYWNLSFNTFTGLQLIFALGLAVDYSSHIAHNFLLVEPPAFCVTNQQKREYKARKAVSQMGSSVIHGGASTFIAISVLAFSESYIFQCFFRMWIGIIIFGIANGFFLLPIILSTCGPLIKNEEHKDQ